MVEGGAEFVAAVIDKVAQPHRVYFVQQGEGGPVKIGVTDNVVRRVKELEGLRGARLTLLAAMPGTMELEQAIHQAFAPYRIEGEWFQPVADVMVMAMLAAGGMYDKVWRYVETAAQE